MIKTHNLSGALGGECFLLVSEQAAIMIDTGFDFCADIVARQAQDILGGRQLDYILLTHSHYDHLSGTAAIQQLYPNAKVAAHPNVRKVLAKESARHTMADLNVQPAADAGISYTPRIDKISIDTDVADGDSLIIKDINIKVIETPGHTWDCISFYFPDDDLLACSESTGIQVGDQVGTVFVVSCQAALDSIRSCQAIGAGRLIIPHYGEITGSEAAQFFDQAYTITKGAADFVLELHSRGKDVQQIVKEYADNYYYGYCDMIQPEKAFLLNTMAMVTRLIAEDGSQT